MRIRSTVGEQSFSWELVEGEGSGPKLAPVGGGEAVAPSCRAAEGGVAVVLRSGSPAVRVTLPADALERATRGEALTLQVAGQTVKVELQGSSPARRTPAPVRKETPAPGAGASSSGGGAVAGGVYPPMPGNIVRLAVAEGDRVATGDLLLVLEAMKMQNELRSPRGGLVAKVGVKPGQKVDKATMLVQIQGE